MAHAADGGSHELLYKRSLFRVLSCSMTPQRVLCCSPDTFVIAQCEGVEYNYLKKELG